MTPPTRGPIAFAFYAALALVTFLPGCTHSPPHDASGASAWYMGTKGAYDYFHRGPDREAGTNFRMPHGEWEFGDTFPLTPDAAKWRPVKLPDRPASPAAPASRPAGDDAPVLRNGNAPTPVAPAQ